MEKPNSGIDPIVSDYYDILFDNVDFYHQSVRDEIAGYNEEITEFEEKLAVNEPGVNKGQLLAQIAENREFIETRTKYLAGNTIFSHGVEFSAEILDDSEPELTDRFKETPAEDKYKYLMNKFQEGYREEARERVAHSEKAHHEALARLELHGDDRPGAWDNVASFGAAEREWMQQSRELERDVIMGMERWQRDVRYSESDLLVSFDAENAAMKKVDEFFPDVAKEHYATKKQEYADLLRDDPVKLHADLMDEYVVTYADVLADQLLAAEYDLNYSRYLLAEHQEAKPGLLRNVLSSGKAMDAWNEKRAELFDDVESCRKEVTKIDAKRDDVQNGCVSEPVRQWVTNHIKSLHPDLVKACDAHMQRHWEGINNTRLEQQEEQRRDEQEKDAGKSVDEGLAR